MSRRIHIEKATFVHGTAPIPFEHGGSRAGTRPRLVRIHLGGAIKLLYCRVNKKGAKRERSMNALRERERGTD